MASADRKNVLAIGLMPLPGFTQVIFFIRKFQKFPEGDTRGGIAGRADPIYRTDSTDSRTI